MITREEAKEKLANHRLTICNYKMEKVSDDVSIGLVTRGDECNQYNLARGIIDELFDQQDQLQQHIKELEEDLMSQGQIAQRALLIGYEEGWFEWKGDAENGGNFSSIETDLKKIRDNTKIYGYIKMMNDHSDALKNKIADLESQLSSNPLQLTCDGCINKPNEGDNYDAVCGYCSRFYGDHFTTIQE